MPLSGGDYARSRYMLVGMTQTVTAPTAATDLVYNGSAQSLLESGVVVSAGNVAEGAVKYKVGDGDWSTASPEATEAGTYIVYYMVEAGNGYVPYTGGPIEVIVN